MRAISKHSWQVGGADNWVLNLQYFPTNKAIVAGSSDGFLRGYSLTGTDLFSTKAHELSVNNTAIVETYGLALCLTDGVKVWDLRTPQNAVHHFTNDKKTNFMSVAANAAGTYVAGGTELLGVDAELYVWDLRQPDTPFRRYVDAHHDDITDIKFHPTIDHYMMLGLTDGYVNVYDIREADEDELIHQTINYSLVHSCHWTLERRIGVLSHMETLGFFDLNDTNYEEIGEAQPHDFGDVRLMWKDCEYVVDLLSLGYVSYGANSNSLLTLLPFNPAVELFDENKPVWFPQAHGEEVVRDLFVVPETKTTITCGEDGHIRVWDLPYDLQFYDFTNLAVEGGNKEKKEKKDKKDKKKDKEKKDRKDKKEKKDKKDKKDKDSKHKSKKDKKEKRFKPY